MAADKLRAKSQNQEGEKKKNKEVGPSSSDTKVAAKKIDEMNKLIKSFS